jgi:hypothetical protein
MVQPRLLPDAIEPRATAHYCRETRFRHLASKVSGVSATGLLASFAGGNRSFSRRGNALSVREVSSGQFNIDFERSFWPSYQHFRPSIIRYDQCPCGFDGIETLHCFAVAVCIPTKTIVANGNRQTFKVAKALRFVIGAPHSIQRPQANASLSFLNLVRMGRKVG